MLQSNPVVATVDDDRRVRESVQSVLESAGYEAVSFASAETFLLSGALSSVTCVIADVRLPGMDGTELQRRIRRERRQLPVIIITAHDDHETRQQAGQRVPHTRVVVHYENDGTIVCHGKASG